MNIRGLQTHAKLAIVYPVGDKIQIVILNASYIAIKNKEIIKGWLLNGKHFASAMQTDRIDLTRRITKVEHT